MKRTVDVDDPGSWRLYFGDETGTPGSILTFVADPDGTPGAPGAGQTVSIALAIPPGSAIFWAERLADHGVDGIAGTNNALAFHDPDGLALELVEEAGVAALPPGHSSDAVVAEHRAAWRKRRDVARERRRRDGPRAHARTWLDRERARHACRLHAPAFYRAGKLRRIGGNIDLLTRGPASASGRDGAGCTFTTSLSRARDDRPEQAQFVAEARGLGLRPDIGDSTVRISARSISANNPRVLFEVATDGPGFLIDRNARKPWARR